MKRPRKLDNLQVEQLKTMKRSGGWTWFVERVQLARTKALIALTDCTDHYESGRIRGQLEAYKIALEIPDILIREAEEDRKRHGTKQRGEEEVTEE